ncbi:MAG: ABC transporter ATP-binding protein [Chitinophagaceae bacterium]|nr:MAG: ABC transporter ATP-binding protein [Chitinophagaceae bacterium]
MTPIIKVTNLVKQFKDLRAVDDLSFNVPAGNIYGFLGQNGAGKSTTMRMLLTLIKPTSGEIELFGMSLRLHRKEILRQVGAIIEKPDLYGYLSGLENLRIFAAMSGVKVSHQKMMDQLEMVGLSDRAHSKVKTYSQGMKQRLGIATALVHDPQLVILDEPTNGLDPQGIADMRNLILHLGKDLKKSVLISSHLLSEIELVADVMLIVDKGRKLVEGNVKDLLNPARTIVELKSTDDASAREKIMKSPLADLLKENKSAGLQFSVHKDEVPALIRQLIQLGIDIVSINARHSLEDYFLSITSGTQHVETFTN